MTKKLLCALMLLSAVPALAQDKTSTTDASVAPPAPPPRPPGPAAYGLPPELAQRIGLSQTQQQKVQDLAFASNDAVIGLEADHKRAQLALERELGQPSPNEATVKDLVEKVGRAETAVRQNRVGLMLAIKKTLGPDLWSKLEAETGPGGGFGRPRPPAPPAPPAPPVRPAPPAPPAPPSLGK
ncbi:periplasmic heavy metal sensor [Melittangium boletus]|uniref:periplasmic heavy metal sensor n=1 Tax=Melittangium boletus TaxID=83453 RepID=UPI003DA332D7